MFDDYAYLSSYSSGMVREMGALAERVRQERSLDETSCVVEVASNDGYLLQHYQRAGIPVLGIEPASRAAEVARQRGVPTRVEYFGASYARRLVAEGIRADVLHAHNVIAHVPDVNDFVAGIAVLLADDGRAVIETPYSLDMVAHNEFDTVYHEHVFYYSVTALSELVERHGLVLEEVERVAHHGGSLRAVARHAGGSGPTASRLLDAERVLGVRDPAWLAGFGDAVETVCQTLLAWLQAERAAGREVAAYGAAAKGTVLLNRAAVDTSLVSFVVDLNPVKQGRLMPGTGQPVLPPKTLDERRPPSCLVLAWNHAKEIYEQLAEYRAAGGRLFVAVPSLRELT